MQMIRSVENRGGGRKLKNEREDGEIKIKNVRTGRHCRPE